MPKSRAPYTTPPGMGWAVVAAFVVAALVGWLT